MEEKKDNEDQDDSPVHGKNMSDHVSFSPGLDARLFYVGGAKKEGYFGNSNENE